MKKQILSLIIILNLFTLSAKTISREYTTDKETGDAVVIETCEGDENGVIERRIQGSQLTVARIIKEVFSSDNKYNYTYTITYNLNLVTGIFDKKEFFYNENSLMEYSVATVKKEGDEYFIVINSDFKPNNIENLTKTIYTLTLKGNNKVKSIFYYNQASEVNQSYFEYGKNDQRVHVREEYKRNSEGLKILESYYSYPDYTYENENEKPYLQISIYENNPHGLLKLVHTENPDGTYFHEYYLDTKKSNGNFNILRTKYSKDRKKIFAEQIYGEELLYGKVYKLHMDLGENKKILSKIYYDKDGNEIPKNELGISE
ncbi:hypothetical protein [Treponema socranskii]|uniref:hypothetical protein n=1 Tax=Treponema socranskii TaxID=53419 RepID=UPI0028EB1340|nr:hypothetical protein [Treponema socranskii]